MKGAFAQSARFAAVGLAATLLHILVGTILISLRMSPPLGNLIAFTLAFSISFVGHHSYSFSSHGQPASQTAPRFAVVALVGFAFNQSLLIVLLNHVAAETALLFATVLSAALTFLLSRLWAFARTEVVRLEVPDDADGRDYRN